jgi:hypothetical protein
MRKGLAVPRSFHPPLTAVFPDVPRLREIAITLRPLMREFLAICAKLVEDSTFIK